MCAAKHKYQGDIFQDLEQIASKAEKRQFLDSIDHCNPCICQDGENIKGECFLRPQNEIKNLVYE
ncbi:MAG: hypothetical protein R6U55_10245 [Desulfovermiculus sp.]